MGDANTSDDKNQILGSRIFSQCALRSIGFSGGTIWCQGGEGKKIGGEEMRKAKLRAQQAKALAKPTRNRKRPQDKHNSRSWQKRNEARSTLQEQFAKAKTVGGDDAV